MSYRGMVAELVKFKGHNGDVGEAYYVRPPGNGPFPGVVLIHHLPGLDEWMIEQARSSPTTAMPPSARICISPKAPAAPTTWARACARRAGAARARGGGVLRGRG